MKHFLFSLLFLLPAVGFAQNLTFQGVPIDGKLEDFEKQLADKGVFRDMEGITEPYLYRTSLNGRILTIQIIYD